MMQSTDTKHGAASVFFKKPSGLRRPKIVLF